MRKSVVGERLPLSEEAYLALGETAESVELFDDGLYLTPSPGPRHQLMTGRLIDALEPGARTAGVHVLGTVNVRLQPRRIAIPDLIVTSISDFDEPVVDARSVALVGEIVSRSDDVSRVLKNHFYAVAGIAWYLLVEQETGALHLHQLAGDHYVKRSTTRVGDVLHLTQPLDATIAPQDLLPPS